MKLQWKNGKFIQVYHGKLQTHTRAKASGGFACQTLCGKTLHRPHLTCVTCRLRRVYYGKMPLKTPVALYVLLIAENRRFAKAKNKLLKLVLTVAEFLAN